jgi:DNA-binding transcriptional MerR regulator
MPVLELEQFIDTRSFDALGELIETISRKNISAKTIGVSYRTICHWDDKGIIRFSREHADANRKYSFVDYVWIKVVKELRAFGVEIPIIQKIVKEIYAPIPIKDIFGVLAESKLALPSSFDLLEDDDEKAEFLEFLKSGEYKTADFSAIEKQFNYLHTLVAEIISTKKPVSLIVFKNGDWFPYIKENEHLYTEDLLYKKEYESQVSVSLTNLVFSFMLEENMESFSKEVNLLTPQEIKILDVVAKGNFKKVLVLYKSKKNPPLEILKSEQAQAELIKVFHKKNFREFIVTDNEGLEYRIRETKQKLDLSEGVKELLKKDDDDETIERNDNESTDEVVK